MRIPRFFSAFQSFGTSGVGGAVFAGLTFASFRLLRIPIDPLLCGVIGMAFWIAIMLMARHIVLEQARVRLRGYVDGAINRESPIFVRELRAAFFGDRRLLATRPLATATRPSDVGLHSKRAAELLLEDATDEVSAWYMPVHALVWSVPALGFVGMAWHLRALVASAAKSSAGALGSPAAAATVSLTSALLVVCAALMSAALGHTAAALSARTELTTLKALRDALSLIEPVERPAKENDDGSPNPLAHHPAV